MTPVDRERIIARLGNCDDSYRAIARDLGVSDWLVRKVARELYDDPRPMKHRRPRFEESAAEDASALSGWLVFGIVAAGLAFAIWAGVRWTPPPEL